MTLASPFNTGWVWRGLRHGQRDIELLQITHVVQRPRRMWKRYKQFRLQWMWHYSTKPLNV